LKQKRQKVKKSSKKGGKRRKIEKKVTKWYVLLCVFVKNFTPDTKTISNVKIGNPSGAWIILGKIPVSKLG